MADKLNIEEKKGEASKSGSDNPAIKRTKKEEMKAVLDSIKELKNENVEYDTKDIETLDKLDHGTITNMKDYNLAMYEIIRNMTRTNPIKPDIVTTKDEKELEFLKCKFDIVYYLKNYVIIPAAGASVKLLYNDKLLAIAKLFEASVPLAFMTSRQSL